MVILKASNILISYKKMIENIYVKVTCIILTCEILRLIKKNFDKPATLRAGTSLVYYTDILLLVYTLTSDNPFGIFTLFFLEVKNINT